MNEAGCLKMNNLVDFNGIWYTLNNLDVYIDKHIHDNGEKIKGVTVFPLYINIEKYDPISFPIIWFLLLVN